MNVAVTQEKKFAGYTLGVWVRKALAYCVGLFLVALGVSISIKSNLGVSPLNALPYVLSVVLKENMGVIVMIIFSAYVVLQILILRKNFKIINLLQFPISILFGSFVALCNDLIAQLSPPNYAVQIVFMLCSIGIMAVGITIYLSSGIVPLSSEGFVKAVQQVTGKTFHRIKMIFDCTLVILAIVVGFAAGQGLIGVREGTVVAALLLGPTIGVVTRFAGKSLKRFCGEAA